MSAADEARKPFSFDWGVSRQSEQASVDMGAPFGDVPASPVSAADSQAKEALDSVRKSKRGRKSREELEEISRRETEEFAKEYATLFDPDVWGGICRSPADLMLHITKKDLWRIEDRELKPLAIGASNTARLFLRTDPKWVALTMFLISLTQIYGTRAALHIAQAKKEREEKKEKAP